MLKMDKDTKESVDRVIYYLEDTERKNWLDAGKPDDHIYCHVMQLETWLVHHVEG